MTDPRDFDQRTGFERRSEFDSAAPDPVWGWVAASIALVVVLVLVFTSGEATNTASLDPPATTGVAPTPNMTNPPVMPEGPSTTGQR